VSDSTIGGGVEASGAIPTIRDSAVGGDVTADGKISDGEGIKRSSIDGDVVTTDGDNGAVAVTDSTIAGKIDAAGAIPRVKDSTVGGSVTAGGKIGDDGGIVGSQIGGGVTTTDGDNGKIALRSATVCGPVTAAGSIEQIRSTDVGGSVTADGAIPTIEDATVFGGVEAGGDISDGEGIKDASITGDVVTTDGDDGKIAVRRGTTIGGAVDAAGSVSVIDRAEVGGGVTAGGAIPTIRDATIGGSVAADGKISDGEGIKGSSIGGDVVTTDGDNGAVVVRDGSEIAGEIDAAGAIPRIGDSTVGGSVTAGGKIGDDGGIDGSTIDGDVETTDGDNGAVTIKNGSEVGGKIDAAGSIPRIGDSTVDGDVTAAGKISDDGGIVDSTIGGTVTTTDDDGGDAVIQGSSAAVGTEASGVVVDAAGDLTVKAGATAAGSVVADGDVVVDGATVEGDATGATVTVTNGGTVEGAITETGGG